MGSAIQGQSGPGSNDRSPKLEFQHQMQFSINNSTLIFFGGWVKVSPFSRKYTLFCKENFEEIMMNENFHYKVAN